MTDTEIEAEGPITPGGIARASVTVLALGTGLFLLFSAVDRLHLDLDAAPVLLAGVTILVLCLVRPSWFWDSWRGALLLRQRWGDSVALTVYVVLALGLLGVGSVRQLLAAQDLRTCRALYQQAGTSHQRVGVLRAVPRPDIPSVLRFLAPYHPRSCDRYISSGTISSLRAA